MHNSFYDLRGEGDERWLAEWTAFMIIKCFPLSSVQLGSNLLSNSYPSKQNEKQLVRVYYRQLEVVRQIRKQQFNPNNESKTTSVNLSVGNIEVPQWSAVDNQDWTLQRVQLVCKFLFDLRPVTLLDIFLTKLTNRRFHIKNQHCCVKIPFFPNTAIISWTPGSMAFY